MMPLKLHYGSRLPLKSLPKWLKNRCRSQIAIEPPRGTRTSVYKGKNHTRTSANNMIKTHAMSLKDYNVHTGGGKTSK